MEKVEMITEEQVSQFSSAWGNTQSYITEEQITELREGKVMYIDDGEYCHFIRLGKDDNK